MTQKNGGDQVAYKTDGSLKAHGYCKYVLDYVYTVCVCVCVCVCECVCVCVCLNHASSFPVNLKPIKLSP